MEIVESLIWNGNYDLKIDLKRLISGNVQVKFFTCLRQKKNFLRLHFSRCSLFLKRSYFEDK